MGTDKRGGGCAQRKGPAGAERAKSRPARLLSTCRGLAAWQGHGKRCFCSHGNVFPSGFFICPQAEAALDAAPSGGGVGTALVPLVVYFPALRVVPGLEIPSSIPSFSIHAAGPGGVMSHLVLPCLSHPSASSLSLHPTSLRVQGDVHVPTQSFHPLLALWTSRTHPAPSDSSAFTGDFPPASSCRAKPPELGSCAG